MWIEPNMALARTSKFGISKSSGLSTHSYRSQEEKDEPDDEEYEERLRAWNRRHRNPEPEEACQRERDGPIGETPEELPISHILTPLSRM